jgi:hypothetical protein
MAYGYWDETEHADLLLKFGDGDDDIVEYLLKARTVKPEEITVGRERLCEHVHC